MRNPSISNEPVPSSPLLPWEFLLFFFILGCFGQAHPLAAAVGTGCLLWLVRSIPHRVGIVALLAMVLLGWGYTWFRLPSPPADTPPAGLLGTKVPVSGCVEDVKSRLGNRMYVYAEHVHIGDAQGGYDLPGILLMSVRNADTVPLPGQYFSGRVKIRPVRSLKNPGCWDGEVYWHRQGIYWRTYIDNPSTLAFTPQRATVLERLRTGLRATLLDAVSSRLGRGLLLALLLGDRSHIDHDLYSTLQAAGIVHTLALSGLHLGFMALFGWMVAWVIGKIHPGIYQRIPRPKLAVFFGIPLIMLYMWLGGFTPSLLRAGIMFFSWALLLLLNRSRVGIDGLCIALCLIIVWSPVAVFSISLQFSALAVAGIICLVPPIQRILHTWAGQSLLKKTCAYVFIIMVVSLVSNLAILPVQVWNFGAVAMHHYYNVVWIPLLGFVVLPLGFIGLLLASFPWVQGLGVGILQGVAWIVDRCFIWLTSIEHLGYLDTLQALRPGFWESLGFYFLLLLFLVTWRKTVPSVRRTVAFLGVGLAMLCMPALLASFERTGDTCRLLVMDTGMSQAVYMELPGGRRILVDGGGSWSRTFDMGRAVVTPVITRGQSPGLDGIFLTHSDCDHLRGLYYPLLSCRVGGFYSNGIYPKGTWDRRQLSAALEKSGVPVHTVGAGTHIGLGPRVGIEILHPHGDLGHISNNDRSLVLRVLVDGQARVLIPGDIEREGVASLLGTGVPLGADVLLLPHHGSGSSYCEELYDRVDPKVAIAAAGWRNRYGFPAKHVVSSLKRRGCMVLSTGDNGAVEVRWTEKSGEDMSVHAMRAEPGSAVLAPRWGTWGRWGKW
ncbi:DNA internalization-related competence protein ComEC/Rec2 [Desulfoplanes sp.]